MKQPRASRIRPISEVWQSSTAEPNVTKSALVEDRRHQRSATKANEDHAVRIRADPCRCRVQFPIQLMEYEDDQHDE